MPSMNKKYNLKKIRKVFPNSPLGFPLPRSPLVGEIPTKENGRHLKFFEKSKTSFLSLSLSLLSNKKRF